MTPMRHFSVGALISFILLGSATKLPAQTFVGTNAPGQGTNFSFSVGAGTTNLSLVISNGSTVYSYLLLAEGRAPTDTDFDFVSRLNGATNQINLQGPEFAVTNYGLRVLTPAASASHAFTVVMTTNRTDLRQPAYPVLKPMAFTTTGVITNAPGQAAFHYFQVDVPTNLPGWRVVLSSANAGADLYVQRGARPTTGSYVHYSSGQSVDTVILDSTDATNGTYFIGVYLPAGTATNSIYTLTAEIGWLTALTWDPGTADLGTQAFTNTSASGGDYYFKITTLNTANGAWRSALKVTSGEADLYLRFGSPAQTNAYNYVSTRAGSDGFVLAQTAQWTPGQDWYLTVHATPGAQWTLLTGEAYVQPLPPLAADASSGGSGTIGPEGMRFFKTTISAGTLAWRIGLYGAGNTILVDNTRAPVPYGAAGGGYYDWSGPGQLLLVPSYVNVGSQYIVGVIGNPGQSLALDSRQQLVTDLPFNSTTTVTATDYGYITYRVAVPVNQIAWQVNLAPASGDPNLAVRQNNVPNEYTNDAFSEISGSVGDSVTMVPPVLSDGTFYITVYGTPPFSCAMTNGQPIITDVHYVFQITNDAPARAGWRFYRVPNTAEQLGTYGWDLELSNQLAGTEIALRRNYVPSRWNYRSCTANCTSSSARAYLDYSGTSGFLQRPGHQADIWYIGVYQPTNALGNFVLSGSELTGIPLSFDGPGSTLSVTNQPLGKWQYFVFTVPATDALGWDLRLNGVTSGDPRLVICRDQLPYDLGTHYYNGVYWYAYVSATWPSGNSWAAGGDWTGWTYNPGGLNNTGKLLAMGMGNPLEPGTYYVGVNAGSGTAPLSYTLVSRGIGTNLAIPVIDVPFTGGSAGSNSLPAREAAYYRVQIASNTPSWKVRLAATNGEAMLAVQKTCLPNVVPGGSPSTALAGGRLVQKAGDEQYLLLPDATTQTNIPPGVYFLAVVSEGQDPSGSTIGSGGSGYLLSSIGVEPTNQLGNLTALGPDLSLADSLQGGEVKHYQFTVSPGVLAMEVRLDNRLANPRMTLRADPLLVTSASSYGRDAGLGATWQNDKIINIATPAASTYTLAVQADTFVSGYSNASYQVVVHPVSATPVTFDGGTSTVTFHSNSVWRFYEFTVPANAFGWDLRLTNTTGDPRLVVCRDLAPQDLGTHYYNAGYWYSYLSSTWPSSNQWAAAYDWTGYTYDPSGTNRYGHILQMGMGNPLEPGHYYAGVYSATPATAGYMNYTLLSRGIGTNLSIPILDLPFVGSASGTNIPAREAVYYKVQVPAGQASWKLRLVPTNGEAMMLIQKDCLPNVVGGGSSPVQLAGGRSLQKPGSEQFTQLPRPTEVTISNGTYYLAVASEGMNPRPGYVGSNSCSFTLYSYGPATTNLLGPVDPSGASDISYSDSLEGGDLKFYQFSVPPGTLSLEVHLENRVANPYMTLRADNDLPRPTDSYGYSDGHSYTWAHDSLINLTSPTPTNYTLCVQARNTGGVLQYSNATYTIRLHALGLIPVAFDGGSSAISGQAIGTWQYFTITVPANAFGWDLRLTNVTSGNPQFAVRRGSLPDGLSTHTDTGGYWYSYVATSWPTNYQWAAGYDWTGYTYDTRGSNVVGKMLQMGMGNPLEPGVYYVGVINSGGSAPMTYTLVSRGIGTNFSIPIRDLPYVGSVATNGLPVSEAAYYRVTVPPGQRNWKLRLAPTSGDAMLMLQKDYLPSVAAGGSSPATVAGGRSLQKAGNEQYLLFPVAGQTTIPGGTYYVAVASEGMNPHSPYYGSNNCDFTLTSFGVLPYLNLGNVNPAPIVSSNALQAGEIGVYQFAVTNSPVLEVRLDNKIGNSYMRLDTGTNPPYANYNGYGYNNGESPSWSHDRILTLPNVAAGPYSLTVQADPATDASFTLVVSQLSARDLAFDRTLSTPLLTNVYSGALSDLQHAYFRVTVPASFNGQPVLGWKLTLAHSQGNPRLRVRQDTVPDDVFNAGSSPWNLEQMAVVPPYLVPGTWYVDVQGQGTSQFTLTSSALLLQRPAWDMPAIGGTVTTPGLPPAGPLFGDTGIDTNGVPLPADQGIDLEQGRFHYYAINVPSNNVGILRTRLDAISGDPDLYLRVGGAPTLSHYTYGDNYLTGTLYDRSLTANIGSEYGNWVPLNGRDELQLTPGTWYLAVQAAGNSNVRYRLQASVGVIANLTYDGVALLNQTLAAGDWRYYRVLLPTNAPTTWNVSFSQILGDVVMYVRDITPPGQGATVTDYRDWTSDSKNHGPYGSVDPPGTTNLACPPLRPGGYYYLGFRAVNDATFTVSSTTNTATIDYTNTIAFYGGGVTNVIPANGFLKYRVDVPADARRWVHTSTHSNTVYLYLEQGAPPAPPSGYHWSSGGYANTSFSQQLYSAPWPWRPGYMYFLLVTNTTALPQNFVFNMNGKNSATDDFDGDGLPDAWELTYWPSIYTYNGASDPDGDGVSNMEEYLEGTNPTNSASFNPRLLVTVNNGVVTRNPVGNPTLTPPKVWYPPNTIVQLTATADPGYSFLGWSGDASGGANPYNLLMDAHKSVTAVFGITNNSGADYQFQLTLASSVGSPPALTDIGVGNTYTTETVDACSRVVRVFPLHNGFELQPTASVIPSNIYTMVLLFRLDQTNNWRRLIDFQAGTSDYGLYLYNGRLYFYPAAQAAAPSIAAGQYAQVVLTRDGTTVAGYVNGVPQFSFTDSSGYGIISANDLRFFKDNTTADDSSGAVARIRLFAAAMPAPQVALLDRTDCFGVPRFLTPWFQANVLQLPVTNVVPGITYRLLASTNLVDWTGIQTSAPPANPALFTDPWATNSPSRFYRLVTP